MQLNVVLFIFKKQTIIIKRENEDKPPKIKYNRVNYKYVIPL